MKKDNSIILDSISIAPKKTRVLKATWTVDDIHIHKLSDDEIEKLKKKLSYVIDKWTWETGSDEDFEKIKELETKIQEAIDSRIRDETVDAITQRMAEEFAETIDNEILKSLIADIEVDE